MFKALVVTAAVLMGGFFMSTAGAKELMCGSEDPSAQLLQLYGEEPYAFMLTHRGALQIVYLNIEKGNWSIIQKLPGEELWCFVLSGVNWNHWTTETKKKKGLKL